MLTLKEERGNPGLPTMGRDDGITAGVANFNVTRCKLVYKQSIAYIVYYNSVMLAAYFSDADGDRATL